jgi:uncharacterized protein with PIN domain
VKFLVDVMCGKLAVYLRMCGHDAAYALDRDVEDDDRLRDLARREERVLVTRDHDLAARTERSLLLTSRDVRGQLRELGSAGVALDLPREPTRCGRCNGPIEPVEENESTPEYAPDPGERQVWWCVECDQHFWKGSHWERVETTLAEV